MSWIDEGQDAYYDGDAGEDSFLEFAGFIAPDTAVARAYMRAEQEKAERDARRLAAAELLAAELDVLHVYDPAPYREAIPHDTRMYEGTGIGALYGLPGSERFLSELGGWRLVPRSTR